MYIFSVIPIRSQTVFLRNWQKADSKICYDNARAQNNPLMLKENKNLRVIKRYEKFLQVPLIKIEGTFLNNTWSQREYKEKFKTFEWNENEYITYQNLWDAVKIVLRGAIYSIESIC